MNNSMHTFKYEIFEYDDEETRKRIKQEKLDALENA